MRALLTSLAALLLASPALAADNELSLEVGTLANADPDYNLFSRLDFMPSWGLRGAWAFHDRLALTGGWQRVRRGADLLAPSEDGYSSYTTVGRAAFTAHELSLGLRGDVELGRYLLPYAVVQGLVLQATSRFDDDPRDEDSPGQLKRSSVALGLLPMAGVEVRIPKDDAPFTIAWHLEAGYGWMSALHFEDLGDMKPGGFALRSGVGLRF